MRQLKTLRILPRGRELQPGDEPHPRVLVICQSTDGFTWLQAWLEPGEDVCWRCGNIAMDPNHDLQTCPHCGGDFND